LRSPGSRARGRLAGTTERDAAREFSGRRRLPLPVPPGAIRILGFLAPRIGDLAVREEAHGPENRSLDLLARIGLRNDGMPHAYSHGFADNHHAVTAQKHN